MILAGGNEAIGSEETTHMTDTNDSVKVPAFLMRHLDEGIEPDDEVTIHFSEEITRRVVKEMRALSSTESD